MKGLLLILIFFNFQLAVAKDWKCEFPTPYVQEGCDGTGCDLLTYDKSLYDVKVYAKPDLKSKLVGHLKKCETIKSVKGYKVIEEFGRLQVNQWPKNLGEVNVKHGDTVEFLNYTGEGGYKICINKKIFGGFSVLVTPRALRPVKGYKFVLEDFNFLMQIDEGKSQAWYKVQTQKGLEGFVLNEDITKKFFISYSGFGSPCQEDADVELKAPALKN